MTDLTTNGRIFGTTVGETKPLAVFSESPTASSIRLDARAERGPWATLSWSQREVVHLVLSRFLHGEKIMTLALKKFEAAWSKDPSRPQDMEYLQGCQVRQQTHVDFFAAYVSDVCIVPPVSIDQEFSAPLKHYLHQHMLPAVDRFSALHTWRSEAKALVYCFLICKGMIAEMGMHGLGEVLGRGSNSKLPEFAKGIELIAANHARDVKYATGLLKKTIEAGGPTAWFEVGRQSVDAVSEAFGSVGLVFKQYGDDFPFPGSVDKGILRRHAAAHILGILGGVLGPSVKNALR